MTEAERVYGVYMSSNLRFEYRHDAICVCDLLTVVAADMAAVESAATEVKTAAMADMVLDAASDADLIMSYLKKLQDQLSSTQKDAQRVAAFRAVLEIEHVPSAMLADATEEVTSQPKCHRSMTCSINRMMASVCFWCSFIS